MGKTEFNPLATMLTSSGASVLEMSYSQPVLLVFLRHFGCTFCREALSDISKRRATIEAMGTRLVFVHMSDAETAERFFDRYGLRDVAHIPDPGCQYYAAFGLAKASFSQVFGLTNWIRGFEAAVLDGHGVGYQPIGDGFQMPGVFVIQNGRIEARFIHKLSADRPDYEALVKSCCIAV